MKITCTYGVSIVVPGKDKPKTVGYAAVSASDMLDYCKEHRIAAGSKPEHFNFSTRVTVHDNKGFLIMSGEALREVGHGRNFSSCVLDLNKEGVKRPPRGQDPLYDRVWDEVMVPAQNDLETAVRMLTH